jgi:hypothetical protein
MEMTLVQWLAMIGAVSMPIFNIPLIVRIWTRKSSEDISLAWVIGVWVCVMAMLPSSTQSSDPVLKVFGIVNAVAFTCVFVVVLKFRKGRPADAHAFKHYNELTHHN